VALVAVVQGQQHENLAGRAIIVVQHALIPDQFASARLLVAHARVPAAVSGRVAFAFASQPLR
jgi:hypothetical protein